MRRSAAIAEERAAERVEDVRRAVLEYNESVRGASAKNHAEISRKWRQFMDLLADYLRLQKAIRRIRKKLVRRAAVR